MDLQQQQPQKKSLNNNKQNDKQWWWLLPLTTSYNILSTVNWKRNKNQDFLEHKNCLPLMVVFGCHYKWNANK